MKQMRLVKLRKQSGKIKIIDLVSFPTKWPMEKKLFIMLTFLNSE